MTSVLQPWVQELTFMQQGVIVSATRGPDGIEKEHIAKLLIRWLRRCTLHMAFESKIAGRPVAFDNPYDAGGGSFTGPSLSPRDVARAGSWPNAMDNVVSEYLRSLDAVPHHFQLHLMHAAEILGYKHPDILIGGWWNKFYRRLSNDMHLNPESHEQMQRRLGDSESNWRNAEEVTAHGPK